MLAFFCENVDDVEKSLAELFCAQVGFEKLESRSARIPACCSFEADFVDGTVRSFLEPRELCCFCPEPHAFFGFLASTTRRILETSCVAGGCTSGGGSSIRCRWWWISIRCPFRSKRGIRKK